jgi:4-hydroxyphenylpyruvate dioxygenase-like putative hemolysin
MLPLLLKFYQFSFDYSVALYVDISNPYDALASKKILSISERKRTDLRNGKDKSSLEYRIYDETAVRPRV